MNSSMWKKIAPVAIHRCCLNIYRDQTVDVGTVRQSVVNFSSSDSDVRDRSLSEWACTAVSL
jgi:hypothetical protein